MSVEYSVVRVSPQTFGQIQQQSGLLQELMDEFHTPQSAASQEKIDARDAIRDGRLGGGAALRLLYVDEFTTSLLVDFMDEGSAFFRALAGWGEAHTLTGVSYGYGEISYYAPEEVPGIAADLQAYPDAMLEKLFTKRADQFRIAAAGYFENDHAIRAHQRLFAGFLRRLYGEAAQHGDYVLLLTV